MGPTGSQSASRSIGGVAVLIALGEPHHLLPTVFAVKGAREWEGPHRVDHAGIGAQVLGQQAVEFASGTRLDRMLEHPVGVQVAGAPT